MEDKVIVTSMVKGLTTLISPNLRFRKVWPKKGAKMPIEKSVLRELIYEPGVENMFKNGLLYIEDMDFKIELGLEQEGTKEPTNILPLNEKYMDRLLKFMPIPEMKSTIKSMSEVQKQELVDYACAQKNIQLDRVSVIRELCGIDILQVIALNENKGE